MPVVNSEILKTINKPNAVKKLMMLCVDHVGKSWERRTTVPASAVDNDVLAAFVVDLDAALPDNEIRDHSIIYLQGGDNITPDHQTQAEYDRRMLAELMQEEDALTFSRTLPWFREFEIRGGSNTQQRATYLGVSNPEYSLVATRYNLISGIVSGLEDDLTRVWDDDRPGWE